MHPQEKCVTPADSTMDAMNLPPLITKKVVKAGGTRPVWLCGTEDYGAYLKYKNQSKQETRPK